MDKVIKEIFELYEKQATNPNLAKLIKTLKEWYFEKENYKQRIDKAIEYIDKHTNNEVEYLDIIEVKELKNILAGDDKIE